MKNLILFFMSTLLLFACGKEDLGFQPKSSFSPIDNTEAARSINGVAQKFLVRIENVTSGNTFTTPFSPGLWVVQKKNSAPIFSNGQPDYGDGLEAIAEDGNPGMLYTSLANHPKVRSRGTFNTPVGATGPAPIFPGDAYEFTIIAKPNDYLNFATMFIQSNDLFIAPGQQGIALFDQYRNPKSGDVTYYLDLWDAGTEINEEPGVGPNQAPRQSGPNTGPTENGIVKPVNDGYSYPDVETIIKVTLTPVG